jgi:hypothetical protein
MLAMSMSVWMTPLACASSKRRPVCDSRDLAARDPRAITAASRNAQDAGEHSEELAQRNSRPHCRTLAIARLQFHVELLLPDAEPVRAAFLLLAGHPKHNK